MTQTFIYLPCYSYNKLNKLNMPIIIPGEDGITAELLKLWEDRYLGFFRSYLIPLFESITPEAWNRNEVFFLKKGDNTLLKNCRPISFGHVYKLFLRVDIPIVSHVDSTTSSIPNKLGSEKTKPFA